MLSDVAMSRDRDGSGQYERYVSFGFQKVYAFSHGTLVGFSGDPGRGLAMFDSMHADMGHSGGDARDVVEHAKEWVNTLYSRSHKLTEPQTSPTQVMMLRTWHDPIPGTDVSVLFSSACVIEAPSPETEGKFLVKTMPWFEPVSIGIGAEVPKYKAALKKVATMERLDQIKSFEWANPGRGHVGEVLAQEISRIVANDPHPAVSVDFDVRVLGRQPVARGTLRSTNPPIDVFSNRAGLDEARKLAALEDKGRPVAGLLV